MTEGRQFCSFIVDDLLLGADVRKVQEVIRGLEITKILSAPWAVRGLVNLRGQVIEAIDLRRCLGIADSTLGHMPFHLIFRTADGPISLLVEQVGSVIEIGEDCASLPPETLKGRMREIVSLVYQLSDKLLPIVDMDRLLSDVTADENRAARVVADHTGDNGLCALRSIPGGSQTQGAQNSEAGIPGTSGQKCISPVP